MSLVEHAKREFELLGWTENQEDEMQKAICKDILELLEVFANQRHSGTTGHYVLAHFEKLVKFEAISPLTGEDSEWQKLDYGCEPAYQNIRCPRVFKKTDGTVYDIEGKVFRTKEGSCYTDINSLVEVAFPYTPKTEIIDVP